MKANEAPEKIYLDSYGSGFSHGFSSKKQHDNDIEYIRTDAFIEKTCRFLFENYHGEKLSIRKIEILRRYLKGE